MICGQTCDGLYHFAFYLIIFREFLVIDYTQKSTISTLAVKLSVSAIIYPWWTATEMAIHDAKDEARQDSFFDHYVTPGAIFFFKLP